MKPEQPSADDSPEGFDSPQASPEAPPEAITEATATAAVPTVRRRGPLAAILEALRGTDEDYTEGSLSRAITLLAIPMVLEMVMESIFAVADIFFVGRLGAEAVATVGLTESLLTVIYSLAVGLSMPAAAMVARRIGEKRPEEAAVAAVQGWFVALVAALGLGLPGAIYAPDLLRLMGASDAVLAQGTMYTRIMLGSNAVIFLLFLNNAVFRGAGDATSAMRALWLANAINLVLDPCLIFGLGPFPELGLTGAAIATATGRGIGVLYQLRVLHRGVGRVRITAAQLRWQGDVMLRLLRLSIGGIGQYLVATASWIALVRITATFGSAALAGYTIGLRLIVFALLPSWGLGNAAATLVGQCLGAGKPDRAARAVWVSGLYNMVFLGLVSVAFIAFPRPLIALFTDQPEVLDIGASCLRIVAYGYLFYAWEMVLVQSFNGAGDTTTPTYINLFSFWICQIPMAYALAHYTPMGVDGVFAAVAVSYSIAAVIALVLFRRGTWKTRVV
ncbi:MAG: MATE family efflux transporter [Acidobacteriota bacterium]|nr:MATE family efflux transporter [Acidobacteriota bacterium]